MKIVIATPVYDGVMPPFVDSLTDSIDALRIRGLEAKWIHAWGNSLLTVARTQLARQAFDGAGAGVLVWADADQSWQPSDLFALLLPIMLGRADVVAAPVAQKWINWLRVCQENPARSPAEIIPTIGLVPASGHEYNVEFFNPENVTGPTRRLRGFRLQENATYVNARRVGFGLCAMAPSAWEIAKRAARNPDEVFCVGRGARGLVGEDHHFCNIVRDAGARIVVHVESRVSHHAGPGVHFGSAFGDRLRRAYTIEWEPEEGAANGEGRAARAAR